MLEEWSETLETECKGSVLLYLQLQTGINRDPSNQNNGKSWLSRERLCKRCAISAPTFSKAIKVLENYKFISVDRRGVMRNNIYTILDLPDLPSLLSTTKSIVTDSTPIEEVQTVKLIEGAFSGSAGTAVKDAIFNRSANKVTDLLVKDKWTASDVAKYFAERYLQKYTVQYKVNFTGIDLGKLKNLLNEYDKNAIIDAIDYAVNSWESMGYTGGGYPTIAGFYAKRSLIFPEAALGKRGKKRVQHKDSSYEEKAIGEF